MEIVEGLQAIYDFFVTDSYSFIQNAFAQLLIWISTAWLQIKIASIQFAWGVAAAVIDNIGLTAVITQAWTNIDPQLLGILTKYKFVDGINMILNAVVTRFIWSMF